MFLDHIAAIIIGYFLFKAPGADYSEESLRLSYEILRSVGRFAFPIFAFSLVDGYENTKNLRKYFLRLITLAIISEPFFDLAFYDSLVAPFHQNVIFTFIIGLMVIALTDRFGSRILGILFLLGGMYLGYSFNTDFGEYGVLIIFGFFVLKNSPLRYIFMSIILAFQGIITSVSLIFIFLYNGKKGKTFKYKYLFYPVHLLILYIILGFLK